MTTIRTLAATTTAAALGALLGWYVRGPRPWWDTAHGCVTSHDTALTAEEITARLVALRDHRTTTKGNA